MKNMPYWRREAMVWLGTTHPNLPAEKREKFYESVGLYCRENPTAGRGGHFLVALLEDHEAFARILREITPCDSEGSAS